MPAGNTLAAAGERQRLMAADRKLTDRRGHGAVLFPRRLGECREQSGERQPQTQLQGPLQQWAAASCLVAGAEGAEAPP